MADGLAVTGAVLPAISLIVTAINGFDIPFIDTFEATSFYPWVLLAAGIAGAVMGWFARKKPGGQGFAILGMILGLVQVWAAATILGVFN